MLFSVSNILKTDIIAAPTSNLFLITHLGVQPMKMKYDHVGVVT